MQVSSFLTFPLCGDKCSSPSEQGVAIRYSQSQGKHFALAHEQQQESFLRLRENTCYPPLPAPESLPLPPCPQALKLWLSLPHPRGCVQF